MNTLQCSSFRIIMLCTCIISCGLQMEAGKLLRKSSDDTKVNLKNKKKQKSSEQQINVNTKLEQDFILTSTNPIPFTREKISLQTKDRLTLEGTLTTRSNARGNIVLCHPAAYDQNFLIPYEEKVFSYYNCIRFNFRRHGKNSKKQCTTLGKKEVYEINAAVEYFKNNPKTKNLPIYGFGISMGAVVLIEAENQIHQLDALILQSPFESLREQIKRSVSFFRFPLMHNLIFREPVRLYAKLKHRVRLNKIYPERSIKKIKTPIFLIHAHNDNVINFDSHKKMKKAGQHCITQTWEPHHGNHTELFKTYPDLYTKKCNTFLQGVKQSHKHLSYPLTQNKSPEIIDKNMQTTLTSTPQRKAI